MRTVEFALPAGPVTATVRDGAWDARAVRYASLASDGRTRVPALRAQDPGSTVFPQAPGLLDSLLGPALGELPRSEDAFLLRVQGPTDTEPGEQLPVLLFVPGGGFTTGGGDVRWYEATRLVQRGRFVLVTAGYRLGAAAGLLEDGDPVPGGHAFDDLVAAAAWVRENVAAFGGDPDRVTVSGDSAGAWFAHALSTSPRTRGWFARTLLVSMPRMAPLSEADDALRRRLLDEAMQGGADVLAAQRAVSGAYTGEGFPFAPSGSADLPAWLGDPTTSGSHLHTGELLLLTTRDEASAFLRHLPDETFTPGWLAGVAGRRFVDPAAVLDGLPEDGYSAAVALQTWWQFESVAHDLADAATAAGHTVRTVRLDLPSPLPRAGAAHCFTLPFLFGERSAWTDAPMLDGIDDATFGYVHRVLSDRLVALLHGRDDASAPVWEPGSRLTLRVTGTGATHDPITCPRARRN